MPDSRPFINVLKSTCPRTESQDSCSLASSLSAKRSAFIPWLFCLLRSLWWGTLSMAFWNLRRCYLLACPHPYVYYHPQTTNRWMRWTSPTWKKGLPVGSWWSVGPHSPNSLYPSVETWKRRLPLHPIILGKSLAGFLGLKPLVHCPLLWKSTALKIRLAPALLAIPLRPGYFSQTLGWRNHFNLSWSGWCYSCSMEHGILPIKYIRYNAILLYCYVSTVWF